MRIRVDPAHHENGEALRHGPFDEGFLGRQIEDVIFVDPGREDQQRPLVDLFRRRLVLQKLDQRILEDDLAGRQRDVLAEPEGLHVGLLDLQLAVAALHVFEEVLHAEHQVFAIARERGAQRFRVGQQEVRRREGVGELADVEIRLHARVFVDAFGIVDLLRQPLAGEQIGLFHQVEDDVLFPFRRLEALVGSGGLDDGLGFLAHQAAGRRLHQVDIAVPELELRLDEFGRAADIVGRDVEHGLGDAAKIEHRRFGRIAIFALGHQPGGLLPERRRLDQVQRQRADIGHGERRLERRVGLRLRLRRNLGLGPLGGFALRLLRGLFCHGASFAQRRDNSLKGVRIVAALWRFPSWKTSNRDKRFFVPALYYTLALARLVPAWLAIERPTRIRRRGAWGWGTGKRSRSENDVQVWRD